MNISKTEIREVVVAIQTGIYPQRILDVLDRIIRGQESPQVVAELISHERTGGATEEEAVAKTQTKLESLSNMSQPIACILMASLWRIAGKIVGMHDVADAIDLWIQDCKSNELKVRLKLLSLSEDDAITRRHYEQWIKNMGD
jgi:hypothetical protein